jgi:hypothetical protein
LVKRWENRSFVGCREVYGAIHHCVAFASKHGGHGHAEWRPRYGRRGSSDLKNCMRCTTAERPESKQDDAHSGHRLDCTYINGHTSCRIALESGKEKHERLLCFRHLIVPHWLTAQPETAANQALNDR